MGPTFCQHVLDEESKVVILLMENRLEKEDKKMLFQWVTALEPLIKADCPYAILVVCANPSGTVSSCVFGGTSAVFRIDGKNIYLCGVLSQDKPTVQVLSFHSNIEPKGKFVQTKAGIAFSSFSDPLNYFMDDEKTPIQGAPPDTPIDDPIDEASIQTDAPSEDTSEVVCAPWRISPTSSQPHCFIEPDRGRALHRPGSPKGWGFGKDLKE